MLWICPGIGLISALGLSAHFLSSWLLPFGHFGMLIYVEPVLLVFVSFALGEPIVDNRWLTYVPIWPAVGVLAREDVVRERRRGTGSEQQGCWLDDRQSVPAELVEAVGFKGQWVTTGA